MTQYEFETIFRRLIERGKAILGGEGGFDEGAGVLSDPAFVSLVQACAGELSNLYQELELAKGETAKRLAEILLPDCWKGPDPGVVVIHARPRQGKALSLENEFSYSGVTFLPIWKETTLVDGDVSHLVSSSISLQCKNLEWSESSSIHSLLILAHREVAIGVDLPQKIENVDGLVFFFECPHDQSALLFRSLPFSRWHHEGKLLKTRCQAMGSLKENIFSQWGESSRVANSTVDCMDSRFVEIEGVYEGDLTDTTTKSKNANLPASEVSGRRIQWFTVRFPGSVPVEVLQSARCYINCFPASNLKLHAPVFDLRTGNETFELTDRENSESRRFLGIECVFSNPGDRATAVPPTEYLVRSEGVTQFDSLDAKQKIQETLCSIEQEFRAYDLIGDKQELTVLLEQVRAMRHKLSTDGTHLDKVFIQFLGTKPTRVEVRYFSTEGLVGTEIKKGQKLNSRDSSISKDSLAAMTDHIRGKVLDNDTMIKRLRHLALSRGRIVTHADITSACNAFFSKEIDLPKTSLRKVGRVSTVANEGVIEVLEVSVLPHNDSQLTRDEWLVGARHLEKYLQGGSSSFLPIEVVVA